MAEMKRETTVRGQAEAKGKGFTRLPEEVRVRVTAILLPPPLLTSLMLGFVPLVFGGY